MEKTVPTSRTGPGESQNAKVNSSTSKNQNKRKESQNPEDFNKIIAAAVGTVIQHSTNPSFRDSCFKILGVHNSQDAKEAIYKVLSIVKSNLPSTPVEKAENETRLDWDGETCFGSLSKKGKVSAAEEWCELARDDLRDWD